MPRGLHSDPLRVGSLRLGRLGLVPLLLLLGGGGLVLGDLLIQTDLLRWHKGGSIDKPRTGEEKRTPVSILKALYHFIKGMPSAQTLI